MMKELAKKIKNAAIQLGAESLEKRNLALICAASALEKNKAAIFAANDADLAAADNLGAPLKKRLIFDETKLNDVVKGLHALAALPDPIGHTTLATELAPELKLYRVACPIGVIGVIFESRPDALIQISSLCLKSGNAVLLKGGSEAINTNRILFKAFSEGIAEAGISTDVMGLLETRSDVAALLALDEYIDLIIPRGSNEFVRYIMDNSRIPVLGHADGICHVYVDKAADPNMAVRISVDSKAQNVAVCNAAETLLVHEQVAEAFLPLLKAAMELKGVSLSGCARTRAIIACEEATDADWKTEYLDYRLSIRVVDRLEDAISHINAFGSGHTDTIVTTDAEAARRFMALVDSAGVFHNCSTRFSDGFRYGFGAEVGVATGKLHARGPMGLDGLCTYKYKLFGTGQTVQDTVDGLVQYTHRPL